MEGEHAVGSAWENLPVRGVYAVALVAGAVLLAVTLASPPVEYRVLRTADGADIGFASMMRELRGAQVVFVGEEHDNREHHRLQLEVIRRLNDGTPLAVALEMFRSDRQKELDLYLAGGMPERSFVVSYLRNWSFPWALYRDIFRYARDNSIPMVGLNVSPEVIRQVSRRGFASLDDRQKSRLPPGVTCTLDEAYMNYVRRSFHAHGLHGERFVNFCEAQMLWNKGMAWNLSRYLESNRGKRVVVLTGAGHAMKEGMPKQMPPGTGEMKVVLPEIGDPAGGDPKQKGDYIVRLERRRLFPLR